MTTRIQVITAIFLLLTFTAKATSYTIKPDKDASVREISPTDNFGTVTTWQAELDNGTGSLERSYMDFDLSSLPSNKYVARAELSLKGLNHTTGGNSSCTVRLVESNWGETSISWNDQPTLSTVYTIDVDAPKASNEDYVIDITPLISRMYHNPTSYYGIEIELQEETGLGTYRMSFASSDHATSSYHPELDVTMTDFKVSVSVNQDSSKLWFSNNDLVQKGNVNLDVTGGSSPYTFSWTSGAGTTQNVSNLNEGTYTVTVTDFTNFTTNLTVNIINDGKYNWVLEKTYDESGTLVGETKEYANQIGRPYQTLSRNFETGSVLAVQNLYDAQGRAAMTTLAAPIGSAMAHKSDFVENTSGNAYEYDDFDVGVKVDNPNQVKQTDSLTLGYYYSNNNADEFVGTTKYPFSRTTYYPDPLGRPHKTTMAGDDYRMGLNKHSETITMETVGDLDEVFGYNNSFKVYLDGSDKMINYAGSTSVSIAATKTVSTDPDGRMVVEYVADGLLIARALGRTASTGVNANGPINASATIMLQETSSTDLHVPRFHDTLTLPLPTYVKFYESGSPVTGTLTASDISYEVYDIKESELLTSGIDYSFNTTSRELRFIGNYAGKDNFVRITAEIANSAINNINDNDWYLPEEQNITYKLDYSHWTLNYYDLAGRLRKTVSPRGFVMGGNHDMYTTYDYDSYGNLIAVKSPDQGLSETVYDSQNLPRFSQDAQQRNDSTFSYVHYDSDGRVTETGEYNTSAGGVIFQNYYEDYTTTGYTSSSTKLELEDGLSDVDCAEQTFNYYYALDSTEDFTENAYYSGNSYSDKSNYTPYYLLGQLSKTENSNVEKWYGYDKRGRLSYLVQRIKDSEYDDKATFNEEFKTIDYTYTDGLLSEKEYQKHEMTEYLTHKYTYNKNLQLKSVIVDDNSIDNLAEVSYAYYETGELKRKVLGDKLQGVDYVYTINGALKSVNSSSLDENSDPGQDGDSGGPNEDVEPDLFGYTLDYHEDDYIRSGNDILTSDYGSEYYGGQIHAVRWKIRDKHQINGTTNLYTQGDLSSELMYKFTYDDYGRLGTATFGVFNNGLNSFSDRMDYQVWGETVSSVSEPISYDLNGNILTLKRNGYQFNDAYDMDDIDYTYDNVGKKYNRLLNVEDQITSSGYGTDFATTGSDAFTYNAMGQLTASDADGVSDIGYTHRGQVSEVTFDNLDETYYLYDDSKNKVRSEYYNAGTGDSKYTWYVYDESGRVMATYERDMAGADEIELKEQPVYGAGQMGFVNHDNGKVLYQMNDHLGNVRVLFSWNSSTQQVDIESWADYYPFGEKLPGRNSTGSDGFRLGYQGQEKAENQSWYNFQLRMYNPSLGRFLSVDPYGQFHSPYLAMANNPISAIDPDGGWAYYAKADRERMKQETYRRLFKKYFGDGSINGMRSARAGGMVLSWGDDLYRDLMQWKTGLKYELVGYYQGRNGGHTLDISGWSDDKISHLKNRGDFVFAYVPVLPEDKSYLSENRDYMFGSGAGGSTWGHSILDQKDAQRAYELAGIDARTIGMMVGTLSMLAEIERREATKSKESKKTEGYLTLGKIEGQFMYLESGWNGSLGYADYLKNLQIGLDVLGLVPVVGEFADALNGVIYAAQGDYVNASLSFAAMVPAVGSVATIGRIGKNSIRIAEGGISRIQNAANRINKPISLVGSRASGTAGAYSDFDYVIEGLTSKEWSKIKNSLPGARNRMDNLPRRIDVFKGSVDPSLPHITVTPK